MASCGYSDEDQTSNLMQEVDPRPGNVPTNRTQRGRIETVQSFFTESDGPDLSR